MTIWLTRAGKRGEQQNFALENGLAVIGWEEMPDLSGFQSQEALKKGLEEAYPKESSKTLSHWKRSVVVIPPDNKNRGHCCTTLKGPECNRVG